MTEYGQSRRLDVVLFGATGFTGRLVADYLAQRAPTLRWAIAGRSREKLQQVKSDLAGRYPALAALEVLVADAADPDALAVVAKDARVVCTTVGPYAVHGRELAAACAEQGTDYCDLAGEVNFIRESIDRNHARAGETRARIVHCCGFDSIPSDLGVHLLAGHFDQQGRKLQRASFFVGPMKGGVSGGTIASMLAMLERASRDPQQRRLIGDPYALIPDRDKDRGPDHGDQMIPKFEPLVGAWTGPFVMAAINTRVVRRTNAITGYRYGKDFRYREAMVFGKGAKGAASAAAFSAGVAAFVTLGSTGPGRSILKPLLPAPGQGPGKAQRDAGFFRVRIVGEGDGKGPLRAVARVEGTSDPGYGETAKMLGESALCLALDRDQLEPRHGVLTPASAMGNRLIERLRAAGMTFAIEGDPLRPPSPEGRPSPA
ncbi:MAG: saccharopine dehydrogenase family protein [Myxococcales bacterium]